MRTEIKYAIFFVSGALIGAGGAFLGTRHYYLRRFEEFFDDIYGKDPKFDEEIEKALGLPSPTKELEKYNDSCKKGWEDGIASARGFSEGLKEPVTPIVEIPLMSPSDLGRALREEEGASVLSENVKKAFDLSQQAYDNLVKEMGYVPGKPIFNEKPSLEALQQRLAESEYPEDDEPEEEEYFYGDPDEDNPRVDLEGGFEVGQPEGISRKAPYLISEDEFAYGDPSHDKVTIYYYAGDDTLADEDETILNIGDHIGFEATEHFDNDVVYVRNEYLGIDYEVVRYRSSYSVAVLGLNVEEEAKRGYRRKSSFVEEEDDE